MVDRLNHVWCFVGLHVVRSKYDEKLSFIQYLSAKIADLLVYYGISLELSPLNVFKVALKVLYQIDNKQEFEASQNTESSLIGKHSYILPTSAV